MASSEDKGNFDKVLNVPLDEKLEALKLQAGNLDKYLSLKIGPTKIGLSEAIGQKSQDAKKLYSKLQSEHKLETWESLISILRKESEHEAQMPKLIDGILAYLRYRGEVWLQLRHIMCRQNVDMACAYAMEELQQMTSNTDLAETLRITLSNAADVLQRLQVEKGTITQQLQQLKSEFMQYKDDLEESSMKRDKRYKSNLEQQLFLRDKQIQNLTAEFEAAAKDRQEMRQVLDTCRQELQDSEKQRREEAKVTRAIFEEFKKIKEPKPSKPENKKPAREIQRVSKVTLQLPEKTNKKTKK